MSVSLSKILDGQGVSTATIIGDDAHDLIDGPALKAAAERIAEALRDAGCRADEPVIVSVSNRPEDISSFFGVWLAGGVLVPVHAAASEATRVEIERQTQSRFSLANGKLSVLSDAPPPERSLLRGAAIILFTSGSTGRPKGVVIGHERFAEKLTALGRLLNVGPSDTVLLPLQLIFVFGVWISLLTILGGARLRLIGKFTPHTMLGLVKEGTVMAAVPSMLRSMFAEDIPRAPNLRAILTGGEALGPILSAQLEQNLPQTGIYDLYGLTETGSCDFCLCPEERSAGVSTLGRPTEGIEFMITDADGNEVPTGAAGELVIRTPFFMLGYLDNPQLTDQSVSDGFFHTGDLVRQREDGFVEIVGRIKEIISRGGNKIAPAEIEILLQQHDDVSQVLCAGAPDDRFGEAVHAAVVLRAGATADAHMLRTWCAERIERFKVPDVIHFVDALPVGPTGKALRSAIRDLATSA